MGPIRYLVVHCTDSPDDRDVTAEEVHRWHRQRGWDGIGYHALIRRDGAIERGRPTYWPGAHARGFNGVSLGVCLAGQFVFSEAQMWTLEALLKKWLEAYPDAEVVGHRDLDGLKTCPNFDVGRWWKDRRGG